MANFVRKISPLVSPKSGILNNYSLESQIKIIKNYFKAFQIYFKEEFCDGNAPIFFQTLGFGAVMNIFPIFYDYTKSCHNGFTIDFILETLKQINGFDIEKWKMLGTGSAAENIAAKAVIEELTTKFQNITDSNFKL